VTGPRAFVCPYCEGDGDWGCLCDGLGVVDAAEAALARPHGLEARPLPPVPAPTGERCHDCAFRPQSPERDTADGSAALRRRVREGQPFYCHQGMHLARGRYVPRETDAQGEPVGHPLCAGWARQRERHERYAQRRAAPVLDLDERRAAAAAQKGR
jgi:hypothetical protein